MKKKNQVEKTKHKRHPRRKHRNPAYPGNGLPNGGILASAALKLITAAFFGPDPTPNGHLFRCSDPKCRAEFGVADATGVRFCIYCCGPVDPVKVIDVQPEKAPAQLLLNSPDTIQ